MQTSGDGAARPAAIGLAAAALVAVALAVGFVLSRRAEDDTPAPAPEPGTRPTVSPVAIPAAAGRRRTAPADGSTGDRPTPELPEAPKTDEVPEVEVDVEVEVEVEVNEEPAAAAASSVPDGEGKAPGVASGVPPVEIAAARPPVPEAPSRAIEQPVPPEPWSPPRFTERARDREAMVRAIRAYGLTDRAVLDAMLAVPRHEFVPAAHARSAYADTPLPIGHGQTISQPYIVAEMTRVLRLTQDSRVLEIGTGSGYQAAVLTEFTPHVYTIEIVKPLARAAKERLSRLGYGVVRSRQGDGYFGWPEAAPFDAVIVTCAAGQIPPPLVEQLRPGGRMVIPVGGRFATQWLMLVEKDEKGEVRSRSLMAVRFVPFVRPGGSAR